VIVLAKAVGTCARCKATCRICRELSQNFKTKPAINAVANAKVIIKALGRGKIEASMAD
jgi:hypothetical protein